MSASSISIDGSSSACTVMSRGGEGASLALPPSSNVSRRRGCALNFQPTLSMSLVTAAEPPSPTNTDTYCFPPLEKLIGPPRMPNPALNYHSCLPDRPEERRVGQEVDSPCKSRG